ncbi:HEAT repeat domain-containing protein [Amycolatopsis rifamycinica]|uniref:MerR family transcriptional regulator n=1 Tax=Amycolatopsis rifamycinica TaxID=287986 RepID=A0A066U3F8_9PSEU|nr:HEAT repeat domain-containing protein [Amycolatopsis rifamycinica]KDN18733.1 MerR family transcriptional regulator [Amycolatopsis rifamycinica]
MLIGEVARRCGVSTRMLRHYESLGLVRPTGRTVGGYREYSAADIRRIFHVEGLRSLGMSLRQIGRALEDPAFTPATLVGDLVRRTEDRLQREQELLERLRTIDAAAPSGWEDVLRVVELLRGLGSPDAARRQQAVLARTEEPAVPVDPLAKAILAESDPNVAGALRWALARAGGDGVASMAPGLRSGDAEVRQRALRAIAELPGPEAGALLAEALDDPDPVVRRLAALAAGRRGNADAVPVLAAMVVEGTNDVEAAEMLGTLSSADEHADRIIGVLAGELAAHPADPAVRIRLAQALAELPGDAARDVLRRLGRDEDPAVALVASALAQALEARPES